jgi:oligopeptide/dipeptide ABC transporter ATP-binding protein
MRVLEVRDLKTYFNTDRGVVKAVDGVSFHVEQGELVGLIGESGCGKSVTMLSVMRLIPEPPGKIVQGKIYFDGEDLLSYEPKGEKMCSIRGRSIAMIFQEPMTSLNPVLTIGRQLGEVLEIHAGMTKEEARRRSIELLHMVGLPDAQTRIDDYPHQFSGGMRQRVMIAMAISCSPKIVIADEPTTAVDVTTQAQLLELLLDMVMRTKSSLIIVTHNLGIVARYVQRIYVMYAGRIVESGPSEEVFYRPLHPYTIGLLKSVPRLGETRLKRRLVPIEGLPPDLIDMPPTCAFLERCTLRLQRCKRDPWPELRDLGGGHYAACYIHES